MEPAVSFIIFKLNLKLVTTSLHIPTDITTKNLQKMLLQSQWLRNFGEKIIYRYENCCLKNLGIGVPQASDCHFELLLITNGFSS